MGWWVYRPPWDYRRRRKPFVSQARRKQLARNLVTRRLRDLIAGRTEFDPLGFVPQRRRVLTSGPALQFVTGTIATAKVAASAVTVMQAISGPIATGQVDVSSVSVAQAVSGTTATAKVDVTAATVAQAIAATTAAARTDAPVATVYIGREVPIPAWISQRQARIEAAHVQERALWYGTELQQRKRPVFRTNRERPAKYLVQRRTRDLTAARTEFDPLLLPVVPRRAPFLPPVPEFQTIDAAISTAQCDAPAATVYIGREVPIPAWISQRQARINAALTQERALWYGTEFQQRQRHVFKSRPARAATYLVLRRARELIAARAEFDPLSFPPVRRRAPFLPPVPQFQSVSATTAAARTDAPAATVYIGREVPIPAWIAARRAKIDAALTQERALWYGTEFQQDDHRRRKHIQFSIREHPATYFVTALQRRLIAARTDFDPLSFPRVPRHAPFLTSVPMLQWTDATPAAVQVDALPVNSGHVVFVSRAMAKTDATAVQILRHTPRPPPHIPSETSIANAALTCLGERLISSLQDPTRNAQIIAARFYDVRDSLLRELPWNFAVIRTLLPADSTPPVFGHRASFTLPSDCVRLLEVDNRDKIAQDARRYEYRLEGRQIHTDILGPLKIAYIRRVDDPTQMDSQFRATLALAIAFDVAEIITGDQLKMIQMAEKLERALDAARTVDGQEERHPRAHLQTWDTLRGKEEF